MNFQIETTRREHMEEVVELLKGLSPYSPSRDKYDSIWSSFNSQTNVYSRVAMHKDVVVGYGAIIIEEKIRGGKLGHIEDIVSHREAQCLTGNHREALVPHRGVIVDHYYVLLPLTRKQ